MGFNSMDNSGLENILKQKKDTKKLFAEKLSFQPQMPLVAIILDHEISKKEQSLIMNLLEGMGSLEVNVIILTDQNFVVEGSHSASLRMLPYSRRNRKYLLEAADIALCFSFNDVEEMLLNGTIPVSAKRKELSDYHPNHETGNAFIARDGSAWGIFAAMVRAVETFKFPYDWKGIVRQGMEMECKV